MYRRDSKSWLKHFDFMVLDLIVLQFSFLLAYILWHGWVNPYQFPIYVSMNAFLLLCDLVIIFFTEPFRNILKRGFYREMESLIQQALFVELFAVMFLFAQQAGEVYSRGTMVLMGFLYIAIGYPVRLGWKWMLKKKRSPFPWKRNPPVPSVSASAAGFTAPRITPVPSACWMITGVITPPV